jgi:hypothetical protein
MNVTRSLLNNVKMTPMVWTSPKDGEVATTKRGIGMVTVIRGKEMRQTQTYL